MLTIKEIIEAWSNGDYERAIALTIKFQSSMKIEKHCVKCGKLLATQSRGQYCKKHRHLSDERKSLVKKSREAKS